MRVPRPQKPSERALTGRRAERVVAQLLIDAGYRIVASNLRLGYLEIDLVARKADLVVVVEVRARTRGGFTTGFGSIGARKRQRVRLAAERLWRRRYRFDTSVTRLRIDAAAVEFDGSDVKVHYRKGAF